MTFLFSESTLLDNSKLISSTDNPRVKAVKKLRLRKNRHKERLFLAEGPGCAHEAVLRQIHEPSQQIISSIFLTESFAASHLDFMTDLHDMFEENIFEISLFFVTADVMKTMTDTVSDQGIVAVCHYFHWSLDDICSNIVTDADRSDTHRRFVNQVMTLAHVQDPGNAGGIIRVADAAGVQGVIFTDHSVDMYNPKLVRSTAGSIFHFPILEVSTLETVADYFTAHNYATIGLDGYASEKLDGRDLPTHVMWVVGNEGQGLTQKQKENLSQLRSIPIFPQPYGQAESLNVATAATICLYLPLLSSF